MNSERPPPGDHYEPDKERERRRLERILPELIKRIVETGYEKISEGPENVRQFVSEMKLPKEALALILAQLDETKNGLYRVVAKEIRDFLEHTNMAEEISKVLTTLSFEIKTEVRFIPNEARSGVAKPDVRSRVRVRKDRGRASQPPPPPVDPLDDLLDDPPTSERSDAGRVTPSEPQAAARRSDPDIEARADRRSDPDIEPRGDRRSDPDIEPRGDRRSDPDMEQSGAPERPAKPAADHEAAAPPQRPDPAVPPAARHFPRDRYAPETENDEDRGEKDPD